MLGATWTRSSSSCSSSCHPSSPSKKHSHSPRGEDTVAKTVCTSLNQSLRMRSATCLFPLFLSAETRASQGEMFKFFWQHPPLPLIPDFRIGEWSTLHAFAVHVFPAVCAIPTIALLMFFLLLLVIVRALHRSRVLLCFLCSPCLRDFPCFHVLLFLRSLVLCLSARGNNEFIYLQAALDVISGLLRRESHEGHEAVGAEE